MRRFDRGGSGGLRRRLARHGFPNGGEAAMFAETKNAFIDGGGLRLGAVVVELFDGLAGAAHQSHEACFDLFWCQRREFRGPKIEVGIHESEAIGVDAIGGADLADDADGGFAKAIGATKDELLLGGKLVVGNDAGTMEAEKEGVGGFRENFAVEIAADQEDGNFFRNAASDAHNLQWHGGGQSEGWKESI